MQRTLRGVINPLTVGRLHYNPSAALTCGLENEPLTVYTFTLDWHTLSFCGTSLLGQFMYFLPVSWVDVRVSVSRSIWNRVPVDSHAKYFLPFCFKQQKSQSHTKVWMSHLYSTFKGGRATFVSLTFLTSPRRELLRESLLKRKLIALIISVRSFCHTTPQFLGINTAVMLFQSINNQRCGQMRQIRICRRTCIFSFLLKYGF